MIETRIIDGACYVKYDDHCKEIGHVVARRPREIDILYEDWGRALDDKKRLETELKEARARLEKLEKASVTGDVAARLARLQWAVGQVTGAYHEDTDRYIQALKYLHAGYLRECESNAAHRTRIRELEASLQNARGAIKEARHKVHNIAKDMGYVVGSSDD